MQRPQQNPGSSSSAPPPSNPIFSRKAFHAAASAADASEQPSVTLEEWWLARVEGHEHKISVAGFYEWNQGVWEFTSGLIAKRHEPCTLETEDGIIVFLCGFFHGEKTLENGFTDEACEKFSLGFPHWWEDWNFLYPNMMSSQTGSQPRSSRTSNSREDSNVPSASMVDSTNDEGKVGIDNASRINKGRQKTPVTSMRRQALHDKTVSGEATHVTPSEKGNQPVGPSRKQRSAFGKLQYATRSPNIISPIPYGNLSPLTRGRAKSLSVSTPEYLKLKKTKSGRVVVPALDSGCQKIIYDSDGSISAVVGLDSPPPLKATSIAHSSVRAATALHHAPPKRGCPPKQRDPNASPPSTQVVLLTPPRPPAQGQGAAGRARRSRRAGHCRHAQGPWTPAQEGQDRRPSPRTRRRWQCPRWPWKGRD